MAQVGNWAWLTLAFLAEIAALAALAVWGWSAVDPTAGRPALAVAAPVVAAVLWGVFAAPRAPVRIPALTVLVTVVVFGAAVLALLATGHPVWAIVLAAAALLSSVLSTPPDRPAATSPRRSRPVRRPATGPRPASAPPSRGPLPPVRR